MSLPRQVRIVEVGPRDGLQNEPVTLPVAVRVAFIEALADAGLCSIEAGSFVSPQWVPQMAGTADVLVRLRARPGVSYPVLVPNMQGFRAAVAAGATEVAVFASASESFSRRNINCSIEESLNRFEPVCTAAKASGIRVRGYVSCVLGCPYEGEVAASAVAQVAAALDRIGCNEISLGDTIGINTPDKAAALFATVARDLPRAALALHFHDTSGSALDSIEACLELGASIVDASVGGLGGCPYAPGARGNVDTEAVVALLHRLGIESGVHPRRLSAACSIAKTALRSAGGPNGPRGDVVT